MCPCRWRRRTARRTRPCSRRAACRSEEQGPLFWGCDRIGTREDRGSYRHATARSRVASTRQGARNLLRRPRSPSPTLSVPMMPDAPVRLSTTTFAPQDEANLSASMRAVTSDAPPGGNGTTMRIGRAGYACPEPVEGVCASVIPAADSSAVPNKHAIPTLFIFPPAKPPPSLPSPVKGEGELC